MRRMIIYFLFFLGLMARGFPLFSDEYSFGPVTVEQAKQAIRNWSGRNNLQIEYISPDIPDAEGLYLLSHYYRATCGGGGIEGIHPTAHGMYRQCYAFHILDPNPDNKYSGYVWVDSYIGKVVGFEHGDFDVREGTIEDMIPPQQAIELAKQICSSYFPDMPVNSFEEISTFPDISSTGSWEHYEDFIIVWLENRIFTPQAEKIVIDLQSVCITIDSVRGTLCDIDAAYEPLEVNPVPTLTLDQAQQALLSYLYGLGAQYVEIWEEEKINWHIFKESPNGVQRVAAYIYFYVESSPDSPLSSAEHWFIAVDGHTGEVVYGHGAHACGKLDRKAKALTIFFNGKEVKTKDKPFIKGGRVYISFQDMEKVGFKIEEKDSGYLISYKDKSAKIRSDEVIRRGNKRYIKGGGIAKLEGIVVRYDKEGKRFHILVRDEKAYQRGLKDKSEWSKWKQKPKSPLSKEAMGAIILSFLSLSYLGWKFLKS